MDEPKDRQSNRQTDIIIAYATLQNIIIIIIISLLFVWLFVLMSNTLGMKYQGPEKNNNNSLYFS